MKKLCSAVLLVLCVFLAALPVTAEETPITVKLDYETLVFDDPPIIRDNRTMVPLRAIFEAIGANVNWNGENRTISSTFHDTTVVMTVDQKMVLVNGQTVILDCAPLIWNDRTFVPVRAITESFGYSVSWDALTKTVSVLSREFSDRATSGETKNCIQKLDNGSTAVFSVSHLPKYTVRSEFNDGTNLEFSNNWSSGFVLINIRTDAVQGTPPTINQNTVDSLAAGLASPMGGTVRSANICTISDIPFAKITYTANLAAYGYSDNEATVTVYTGVKGQVTYTITATIYGDVPDAVETDIAFIAKSMQIIQ